MKYTIKYLTVIHSHLQISNAFFYYFVKLKNIYIIGTTNKCFFFTFTDNSLFKFSIIIYNVISVFIINVNKIFLSLHLTKNKTKQVWVVITCTTQ